MGLKFKNKKLLMSIALLIPLKKKITYVYLSEVYLTKVLCLNIIG